jgi:hypothetical protein
VALAPEGTLSFGRFILDSLGVDAAKAEETISALKADDYAVLRGLGAGAPDAAANNPGTETRTAGTAELNAISPNPAHSEKI